MVEMVMVVLLVMVEMVMVVLLVMVEMVMVVLLVVFKLTVTVYRAVHGTAPRYLSDLLQPISDIISRRRLRSLTFSELVIPLSQLVIVGDRSFSVAGPRLWNTLSEDITSVPSLWVF